MSFGEVIFGNGGLFWIFLFIVFIIVIAGIGLVFGILNVRRMSLKTRAIIVAVCAIIIIGRLIIFFCS